MRPTRRQFLLSAPLLGGGLALGAGLGPGAGARAQSTLTALFLDIGPVPAEAEPEALRRLLAPLVTAGVPFGLSLDPAAIPREGELAAFLRRLFAELPGLAEPLMLADGMAEARPYFQMRDSSLIRQAAVALLGPDLWPTTLVARGGSPARAGDVDIDAARWAGFRAALLAGPEDSGAAPDYAGDRLSCLIGTFTPDLVAEDPMAPFDSWLEAGPALRLSVPWAALAALPADLAERQMQAIAARITQAIADLVIFANRPRDVILWAAPGNRRRLTLALAPAADDAARAALIAEAAAAGVPLTDLAAPEALPRGWRLRDADTPLPRPEELAAQGTVGLIDLAPPGAGNRLDEGGAVILRDVLVLDGSRPAAEALASVAPTRDLLILATPDACARQRDRAALLAALAEARDGDGAILSSLVDHLAALMPPDPVFAHYGLARAALAAPAAPALAPPPLTPEPLDRGALMADARRAWSYVTETTEAATGLCPSTRLFAGRSSVAYRVLTMWDMASLIFAHLAARDLHLIDAATFQARAARLIGALPVGRIAGHALPPAEIATNRPGAALSVDFNACDTGRLLSALAALGRDPALTEDVAAAVARWDLPALIREGTLNSVTAGRIAPPPPSHCTPYVARALAAWGLAADPGLPWDSAEAGAARDMRLIYHAAGLGPLGAEPLLLEALEFRASPAGERLQRLLWDAQARAHAETGQIVCPTEGPMDRAPWFSYQGLDLTSLERPWSVATVEESTAFSGATFQNEARMVSSKAAYLWLALRPGDALARAMVAHVRDRASLPVGGFAAGVYSRSGRPTEGYTDINTNGVILQALARLLA